MSTTASPERLEFKTELKQLLDLIIHSLYTKKEIFLRELISNAADAIDKVRFESLTNQDVLEGNGSWKIKLIPDEAASTLTIRDNGIGMNRQQIIDNLGTIAKSGTRAFMDALGELLGAKGVRLECRAENIFHLIELGYKSCGAGFDRRLPLMCRCFVQAHARLARAEDAPGNVVLDRFAGGERRGLSWLHRLRGR